MRTMNLSRIAPIVAAAAIVAPVAARAQNAAIDNNPATVELGADAGATFGLGHNSYTVIQIPGSRVRAGFFLPNNSRIEIEPAVGLTYGKVTGQSGVTNYNLELGALYHFGAPASVINATRATVAYVRPFINYTGLSGGGNSNHAVSAGGGLGLKLPFRPNIALRGEANLGYDFNNKAARAGALAGFSFFTNR